jgi:glyoxylase-like metal-dependent hydrolase (beta-lactamase superfamily II)
MVDGGSGQSVSGVYTVFQVRFPTGWIMIDAGMDPEIAGDTTEAYRRADEQVRRALEGASTIVVTHEHHDHVGGVVRSPSLERLLPRTRLTTEQIRTLMERPNVPLIRLDSAAAARYRPLDYDRTYPLAPGVVLIKAPGHTPGSQMVYLRLASGKELLLIGDVAWAMAGVERRRLPPPPAIKEYGMNPNQIALQLDWLHSLLVDRPEIAVTNAHDDARLEKLIRQGVLVEGLIGATQ